MTELEELLAEQAQAREEFAELLMRISRLQPRCLPTTKPLLSSQLGGMGFALSSNCVVRGALHEVTYSVVHAETRLFLGSGITKGEALALARQALSMLGVPRVYALVERLRTEHREKEEEQRLEFETQRKAEKGPSLVRSMPKRRRQIFEASGGKCHYCETALTIDGRWHIEHKMPKALLGGDEPSNLVASCVPCNASKRDKTDQEFFASRGAAA